ncbi:TlpA disulfide reductase family protein [Zobellella aerophila]|uniref:Thioredoxin domain-containing protein n=1 Tax=Zobellella aerophila TaxID=870480 RepID=A0ABP6VWP4_9GAMM
MRLPSLATFVKQLATVLVLLNFAQFSYADSSFDAEGERRAKGAGASLAGQLGPVAELETIDGEKINLVQLYGKKPVYLKFWATWCVPCRQQMPGFEDIQQKFGDKIQVIAVNTGFADDIESIHAYRKEHGLTMPIVIDDGSLATGVNLRVTPQHVVIGRDGRIAHIGHLDNEELHAALRHAVAEDDDLAAQAATDKTTQITQFEVGDKVSDLQITMLDGTRVSLAAPANHKPRALVFFAPWCESYLAESRPRTSQACRRVREDVDKLIAQGGLDWLGISSGLWVSTADLQDYKDSSSSRLPLALDEDDSLFRAFGIRDIPSIVLLDAQGRVADILGPQDAELVDAVNALQ